MTQNDRPASVSPVFTIAQIDEPNIHTLLSYLHSLFHLSAKVLKAFLQNFIKTKDDVTYLNNLTQTCSICQWTNPNSNICPPPFPTHDIHRHRPTQNWQVDFTHMPPVKRVKFLLAFVDAFSRHIEAFLTTNKGTPTVAQLILTEILPRFGMPSSLQSDNRGQVHIPNHPKYCKSSSNSLEVSHSLPTLVLW